MPRAKDKTYLYVSNPPMIHTQSSKINHYLGLAEIYIRMGTPEKFTIEVKIADDFITDAVTEIDGTPVLIELQRSVVSTRKMQDKVDKFVAHYNKHGAKHMWIFTDKPYDLSVPRGFLVEQKKMTLLQ